MSRALIFSFVLLSLASFSRAGVARSAEPLPEPPEPPPSAKLQPPPEPVPAPQMPVPSADAQLSPGSIVTGPVELYPHVRVKDLHHVAPGAATVVVAVRDPNVYRKDAAGIVFVKVCVPTCPLCKLRVNKLGNHLKLDYGKYKVGIRSHDGLVTVDYDH